MARETESQLGWVLVLVLVLAWVWMVSLEWALAWRSAAAMSSAQG